MQRLYKYFSLYLSLHLLSFPSFFLSFFSVFCLILFCPVLAIITSQSVYLYVLLCVLRLHLSIFNFLISFLKINHILIIIRIRIALNYSITLIIGVNIIKLETNSNRVKINTYQLKIISQMSSNFIYREYFPFFSYPFHHLPAI